MDIVKAPGASIAQHETTTAHSAALAKAEVEARFAIAAMRPRDMDRARHRILDDCKRPRFAAVALYAKPVGDSKIVGLSVRFAEAAVRALGNIETRSAITYEDDSKRVVKVCASDLESNTTYDESFIVEKHVERKFLKRGQKALHERVNSYGDTVYIVSATEDEIATKQGAKLAKVRRNLQLMLIPGDLADEAKETIHRTMATEDARDPSAARKSMLNAFATVGVTPAMIRKWARIESTEQLTPKQITELRTVYASIREGHDVAEFFPTEETAVDKINESLRASKPSAKKDTPIETTAHDATTGEVLTEDEQAERYFAEQETKKAGGK